MADLPCGHQAIVVNGTAHCCGRQFKVRITVTEVRPRSAHRVSRRGQLTGIRWRDNRWEATLGRKYLGRFRRQADAMAARKAAILNP